MWMWEVIIVLFISNPSARVQLELTIRVALVKGCPSGMGEEGDTYMNFLGALQCVFFCKANIDESYVKKLHTAQNHNDPTASSQLLANRNSMQIGKGSCHHCNVPYWFHVVGFFFFFVSLSLIFWVAHHLKHLIVGSALWGE